MDLIVKNNRIDKLINQFYAYEKYMEKTEKELSIEFAEKMKADMRNMKIEIACLLSYKNGRTCVTKMDWCL